MFNILSWPEDIFEQSPAGSSSFFVGIQGTWAVDRPRHRLLRYISALVVYQQTETNIRTAKIKL